jgi:NAD+ synthase (glutamine-hydrolysing)
MRIGIAQLNTTVGDLAGNRRKILAAYDTLVAQGAQLVVYPELAVTGYPPRDLLFKSAFVPDNEDSLAEIAAHTGEAPALVGFVETNPSRQGRRFHNAAALCQHGKVRAIARKCLLPTYDVFDEDRYFEPGDAPCALTATIAGARLRIGVTICEDLWKKPALPTSRLYRVDPVATLATQHLDLAVNLSASPWHHAKEHLREQLVTDAARALRCPFIYVNAVGGNDELIFDGQSLVAAPDGTVRDRLTAFAEDVRIVEIEIKNAPENKTTGTTTATAAGNGNAAADNAPAIAADDASRRIHAALVLGLRDYAAKSGFKRAHIALSGGIDSAVVAALAADALGAENLTGISLPSAFSSQHSRDDARALAQNLGIAFETIAIAPAVEACERALAPLFAGRPRDTAEENIQARVRGLIMMALSNKFGTLLLTTGNKSETAVGYCTLYGDMCGGLAVISDLFKTQVYALARWLNRDRELIPRNTLEKPPSAELRPDQLDQDSLPPYDELDAILKGYVEEGASRRELIARGHAPATVHDIARKVDLNEYKRKQAAPGLKITPLAFGTGRRIPIVQKYVS